MSMESGGRYFVGSLGRNMASIAVNMFSHLTRFSKTFHKFSTSDVISKNDTAMNWLSF
jgi:hypothetical protein